MCQIETNALAHLKNTAYVVEKPSKQSSYHKFVGFTTTQILLSYMSSLY